MKKTVRILTVLFLGFSLVMFYFKLMTREPKTLVSRFEFEWKEKDEFSEVNKVFFGSSIIWPGGGWIYMETIFL